MSDVILTNRLIGNTFLNSAVLRVLADKDATVSITKANSSISLAPNEGHNYNNDDDLSTYYFIIPSTKYDTYTVESISSNGTLTQDITISSNQEYSINMRYIEKLFWHGVNDPEHYPWVTFTNSNGKVSIAEGYLQFNGTSSGYGEQDIRTTYAITTRGWNYLKCKARAFYSISGRQMRMGLDVATQGTGNRYTNYSPYQIFTFDNVEREYSLNISGVSANSYKVCFGGCGSVHISEVWLSK